MEKSALAGVATVRIEAEAGACIGIDGLTVGLAPMEVKVDLTGP